MVEIKREITWDDLKLVTMMFVNDGDFSTLGERTYIQWDEVMKQNQRTMNNWSGGLRLYGENLKS